MNKEQKRLTLRVLLVENDVDNAKNMAFLLQQWGYQVHMAADGVTALQMADECRPDIVLLDIGMPGMDGRQVAEQLRERAGVKRPVIIALTGSGQNEDRRRCREAGIDLHIVKPVDPVNLGELMARFQILLVPDREEFQAAGYEGKPALPDRQNHRCVVPLARTAPRPLFTK